MSHFHSNMPWEQADLEEEVLTEIPSQTRVILFNDDWHSFDEVIQQIIKATGCTYTHAERCTNEVHNQGRSMVFEGSMNDCLRVSSILEEIALHTQIEL